MTGLLWTWGAWILGIAGIGGVVAAVVLLGPGLPVLGALGGLVGSALRWAATRIAEGLGAIRERPRAAVIVGLALVVGFGLGYLKGHAAAGREHAAYRAKQAEQHKQAEVDSAERVAAAEKAKAEALNAADWARIGEAEAKREAERTFRLFAAPNLPALVSVPSLGERVAPEPYVSRPVHPLPALGLARALALAPASAATPRAVRPRAPTASQRPGKRMLAVAHGSPWRVSAEREREPVADLSIDDLVRRALGSAG